MSGNWGVYVYLTVVFCFSTCVCVAWAVLACDSRYRLLFKEKYMFIRENIISFCVNYDTFRLGAAEMLTKD